MNKIFSVNFWVQSFATTLITIFFIYILKIVFNKVQVPVVSEIVEKA